MMNVFPFSTVQTHFRRHLIFSRDMFSDMHIVGEGINKKVDLKIDREIELVFNFWYISVT